MTNARDTARAQQIMRAFMKADGSYQQLEADIQQALAEARSVVAVNGAKKTKADRIVRWLHHQAAPPSPGDDA